MCQGGLALVRRLASFEALEQPADGPEGVVVEERKDGEPAGDAAELAQDDAAVRGGENVVQEPVAEHQIDGLVRKGEAGGVALSELGLHAGLLGAVARVLEYFGGDVHLDNVAVVRAERGDESSSAAGHVEHAADFREGGEDAAEGALFALVDAFAGTVVEAPGVVRGPLSVLETGTVLAQVAGWFHRGGTVQGCVAWNNGKRRGVAIGAKNGVAKDRMGSKDGVGMRNILNVLMFGRVYLRRYWTRLVAGLLLGLVFGVSNASFVWATKTLTGRLAGEDVPPAVGSRAALPKAGRLTELGKQLGQRIERVVDPWLPRRGVRMDWRMFLGGLLFLPLLVSVRSAADYSSNYCMGWVSERVVNDLRYDVLAQMSTLSLDFFNRSTSGDLITRITVDTSNLLRALRVGVADLVKESMTIVSVFIALCFVDWKLTLFAVALVPLCFFPLIVLGKKARRAMRSSLKANIDQSSQLVELLGSIRIVKAFGLESRQLQRFRLSSKQMVHHGMKGIQAKELVNPIIEVTSLLGVGLLIVYLFHTERSVPDLVGFMTGLIMFFVPVKKLAALHILFEQAGVGVDRLMEIMHARPSVRELPEPKPLPGFREALVFDNVTFAYGEDPVLQNLSLTVPRGFKLGVAGESGSGKSTLVNLLFRFYDPCGGAICIDGLDIREVSLQALREQMALVSQEVVLFDQTVAENIACGKSGATQAEIEVAARQAFAHDFIQQLPQGYDTRVGERGVTLSGGQRQRLAIARAFIRDAPILALDEATAALDSKAEAEVQAAIDRLSQNRTVVCVAHRLSTLANCDAIIVLAQGRLVEQGTFQQLLASGGGFAQMARKQGIIGA